LPIVPRLLSTHLVIRASTRLAKHLAINNSLTETPEVDHLPNQGER
jgi:hypothetical protein